MLYYILTTNIASQFPGASQFQEAIGPILTSIMAGLTAAFGVKLLKDIFVP